MASDDGAKQCFVVSPIGADGSPERGHADWVLDYIIKPVLMAEPFFYEVKRADEIPDPGSITQQAIMSTLEADLVIAILTGHNANVFYELAIRHMAEKPAISMIQKGERIPFDNQDQRSIEYSLQAPKDLEEAKEKLRVQVEAVNTEGHEISNPITRARGHQALANSSDSRDNVIAELGDTIRHLTNRTSLLEAGARLGLKHTFVTYAPGTIDAERPLPKVALIDRFLTRNFSAEPTDVSGHQNIPEDPTVNPLLLGAAAPIAEDDDD